MKITIDITPTELAEFIFALVDADFEVEDEDDTDAVDAKKELFCNICNIVDTVRKFTHKPTT